MERIGAEEAGAGGAKILRVFYFSVEIPAHILPGWFLEEEAGLPGNQKVVTRENSNSFPITKQLFAVGRSKSFNNVLSVLEPYCVPPPTTTGIFLSVVTRQLHDSGTSRFFLHVPSGHKNQLFGTCVLLSIRKYLIFDIFAFGKSV